MPMRQRQEVQKMLRTIIETIFFIVVILTVFSLDSYTKKNAVRKKRTIVYNRGAFIGLLKKRRKLLSFLQLISLLVLLFLFFYYDRFGFHLGLSFIFGGSLGNSYEHIRKGAVTDFIRIRKLYVNIADISILTGLLICIVFTMISI